MPFSLAVEEKMNSQQAIEVLQQLISRDIDEGDDILSPDEVEALGVALEALRVFED